MCNETGVWNVLVIRGAFKPNIAKKILATIVSPHGHEDVFYWPNYNICS